MSRSVAVGVVDFYRTAVTTNLGVVVVSSSLLMMPPVSSQLYVYHRCKVGAALSMCYKTGQPILFVGTGQKYTHLRKLNVNYVIKALFG